MNVIDFDSQCNPEHNQQTPGQIAASLTKFASDLATNVQAAAKTSDSFDSVERAVFSSVIKMGFQAMELLLACQGDGDLGKELQASDGKTLRRSQATMETNITSVFGKHTFRQYTYAIGKNKAISLRPVSARVSMPESRWSFLLQEFSQMLGVDQAYDQAMQNLGTILGGKFSVDTAERINGALGRSAGEFLADLPKPESSSEGKLLVATADCKGVPLVKEDCAKVAAFETARKRPGNRRMATVASVYSVDPYVRTAEDITAALFRDDRDDDSQAKKRPVPKNKNTTAHFPEVADNGTGKDIAISGIHVAMTWIIGQLSQRRRAGQVLIALMDGQESLWKTLGQHLPFGARTVPVLDVLHALAYVWEAAGLFEKDDVVRKQITRDRVLRILRGEVRGVIQGLRAMGTRRKLKGEQLKSLHRICGYLEKNADRMRYDEYLRRGYPIASGVIEGACRHLVKDRMERSGMRWTLEGARSMLNVRAAFQSDHWRSFLDWRIKNEIATIHRHRNLIDDYTPSVLAC